MYRAVCPHVNKPWRQKRHGGEVGRGGRERVSRELQYGILIG